MTKLQSGGYAAIAKTEGIGRNVLEARLKAAAEELQTLFDNLTRCQTRGNEFLEEVRELRSALRLLGELRALECSVSEPACRQCVRCLAKKLVTP